jgi:hypothetical protein
MFFVLNIQHPQGEAAAQESVINAKNRIDNTIYIRKFRFIL